MSSLDDLKKQLNSGKGGITNLQVSNASSFKVSANLVNKSENLDSIKSKMQTTSVDYDSLRKSIANNIIETRKNTNFELAFLLDRSGSCARYVSTTIKGYNDFIEKQKLTKRNELVSTILFDDYITTYQFRTPIELSEELDYRSGGRTALYDTVVYAVDSIMQAQETTEPKIDHTLITIMTDGYNCAGKSYMSDARNAIITAIDKGYHFILLGALEDENELIEYGRELGIPEKNISLYLPEYTESNFKAIEVALDSLETKFELGDEWKKHVVKRIGTASNQYSLPNKG